MNNSDTPLCVDLDGTLVRSDVLIESFLLWIKQKPWMAFRIPFWLMRGRAYLKEAIANRVHIDAETLPYQIELLDFIRVEAAKGRPIILVTSAAQKIAEEVASHLGIFTAVHASGSGINLQGTAKSELLVRLYGERGFDYAGNSRVDLPVWSHARLAVVVNPGKGVLANAAKQCQITVTFISPQPTARTYAQALRFHQWLKNVLVFVPMLGAHAVGSLANWSDGFLAFISFSLCASSVYLLNDLLDLPADRLHPRKRDRPFASGALPLTHGLVLSPLLVLAGFVVAILSLPPTFGLALAGYYLLTLSYSIWLKAVVLLDALILAALYTLRVIGGAAATHLQPSFWLLAFFIFLFFSMALVKRYSELLVMKQQNRLTAKGRGYHVEDLLLLMGFGITSGVLSILVFALYINSEKVKALYRNPAVLWLVCPVLLYWISRIWLITHRGDMHDDPVVFATKDKSSWLAAAVAASLILIATI
ncbi:prenyltransferase, UbiA family [mine drainage metagenome]|uniref:Prenyltransferase, UbiA family n=1 Tax=mine drainage metagenome TaxID=410659 RepID=T1APK5_9ZZZZ